jgi:hypothetical protein
MTSDGGAALITRLDVNLRRSQFVDALEADLATKGFRIHNPTGQLIRKTIFIAFILSQWPSLSWILTAGDGEARVGFWSGLFANFFASFALDIFMAPGYLIVAYILLRIWMKIAGPHWLNNAKIRQIWPELEGYKRFIKQTDFNTIQYDVAHHFDPAYKTFPYAIAFGLDKAWDDLLKKRRAASHTPSNRA